MFRLACFTHFVAGWYDSQGLDEAATLGRGRFFLFSFPERSVMHGLSCGCSFLGGQFPVDISAWMQS